MIDFEPRAPLETEVKRRVVGLYRRAGCFVVNLDQGFRPGGPRHATTRQTKGIGDIIVMPPRSLPMFWHEVKRDGGIQSWEQQQFEAECRARQTGYVLGGPYEALVHLVALGLWRLPEGTTPAHVAAPVRVTLETEAQYLKRMARKRRGRAVATAGLP